MRELVYLVATSLDGYIAGPGGDFSAFPSTGDHIDALLRELPETLPGPMLEHLGITPEEPRFDAVVMGWNTYAVAFDVGTTDPYPHLETTVFSRSRDPSNDPVRVTGRDPLEVVNEMRGHPGRDIWLCGGGALAAALAPAIDRLVLKVNPIVLGGGVPLFAGAVAGRWELVSTRHLGSGVILSEYCRARPPSAP